MGVEICFRHLHNELSFSYTSFDNFIACLQTYLPKEYWPIMGCLSWESNISEKEYYGPHGTFKADRHLHHTHEGSIGNLCNDKIAAYMEQLMAGFHFERVEEAERRLVQ